MPMKRTRNSKALQAQLAAGEPFVDSFISGTVEGVNLWAALHETTLANIYPDADATARQRLLPMIAAGLVLALYQDVNILRQRAAQQVGTLVGVIYLTKLQLFEEAVSLETPNEAALRIGGGTVEQLAQDMQTIGNAPDYWAFVAIMAAAHEYP